MSTSVAFLAEAMGWGRTFSSDQSERDENPAVVFPAYAGLYTRVRSGDSAAFDALMDALARPLTAYALRFTGSLAEAQDVVQDVFVHLWEHRVRLNIHGSVRAYLYTAVRNRAMQLRRGGERETARWARMIRDGHPPGMAETTVTADSDVERAEIVSRVHTALDALPPRARETALLRWSDGMSRQEIADIMGVSVATVNNQLTLAGRVVRALLGDLRGDL